MALSVGDKAPNFTLPGDGGSDITLADFGGKAVVLYFYPKDMTPGCTTESIDFSDMKADFDTAGCQVIGMSKDSVKRHDKFIAKHELDLRLASDEDGSVIDTYGVWVLKKLYGREYMGIERATFLIDADGVIRNIWRKVKVKGHAQEVLAAARAL